METFRQIKGEKRKKNLKFFVENCVVVETEAKKER